MTETENSIILSTNSSTVEKLRKHNSDDNVKPKLIVNYLPNNTSNEQLYSLFQRFGKIINYKVVRDEKGVCIGYGFVEFDDITSAEEAISSMNGFLLYNKRLKVSFARSSTSNVVNCKIYVSNLPISISESELTDLFKKFGTIIECRIPTVRNNMNAIAFILFEKSDEAEKALSLNGYNLGNHRLLVKFAAKIDGKKDSESSRSLIYSGSPNSIANYNEKTNYGYAHPTRLHSNSIDSTLSTGSIKNVGMQEYPNLTKKNVGPIQVFNNENVQVPFAVPIINSNQPQQLILSKYHMEYPPYSNHDDKGQEVLKFSNLQSLPSYVMNTPYNYVSTINNSFYGNYINYHMHVNDNSSVFTQYPMVSYGSYDNRPLPPANISYNHFVTQNSDENGHNENVAIVIYNLPSEISSEHLFRLLSKYSKILDLNIDKTNCTAKIILTNRIEANKIYYSFNNQTIASNSKPLKVDVCING